MCGHGVSFLKGLGHEKDFKYFDNIFERRGAIKMFFVTLKYGFLFTEISGSVGREPFKQ
jgi:hypothetical protein